MTTETLIFCPTSDNITLAQTTKRKHQIFRPTSDYTTVAMKPRHEMTTKTFRPTSDYTTVAMKPRHEMTTKTFLPTSDYTTVAMKPRHEMTTKTFLPIFDDVTVIKLQEDQNKEQKGDEGLQKFCQDNKICREVSDIFYERSEIEQRYAESLTRLALKAQKTSMDAPGTLKLSWENTISEMKNEAAIHRTRGNKLYNEVSMQAFVEEKIKTRTMAEAFDGLTPHLMVLPAMIILISSILLAFVWKWLMSLAIFLPYPVQETGGVGGQVHFERVPEEQDWMVDEDGDAR